MTTTLTAERAAQFARIALGHVTREYPHKADHVMTGDGDVYLPRVVHPIFYGSFDWHSCVHGYWLLARIRRLFPEIIEAAAIDALFADAFTPEKVERERAYLDRPEARGFERPYGWAWLLMLAADLRIAGSPYATIMQPLADAFVRRFHDFLPILTYPVRAGTHASTAFALVLAGRYADVVGNGELRALLADRARHWFDADRDAQAWEPSGEDFLSPTLIEAAAMATLMPPDTLQSWFAHFLPRATYRKPATLFTPATVSDRSDGRIAHLDGLNLSRAWAFRIIAETVDTPAIATVLNDAANSHLAVALNEVEGDYMGEHWLASFALLALTW